MLLLQSSHVNATPEKWLSAPKLQMQNVARFLEDTVSTAGVNADVRICVSQK